jgi:glycosyltransferase involved in cell wall biosynthesis
VGTDVAGINEVVANGETGLLHPVEDVDGMASSVSRLLEEKERARNLGAAGRTRVRERFSAAVSARRLLGLYHECLGLG